MKRIFTTLALIAAVGPALACETVTTGPLEDRKRRKRVVPPPTAIVRNTSDREGVSRSWRHAERDIRRNLL